jgi:hypothetical protein
MTENECCNLKFENEEAKDELSFNLDEQLTRAILQCDELQKKQKLVTIHSKIKILQIIKMMKKSCLIIIQEFTVNLNDLHFIAFIVSMRAR